MPERRVTVVPEEGLHARPASVFVETANEYDTEVLVGPEDAADDDLVPASSMLAVTGLGAAGGDTLRLVAEGEDAEAALDALEDVLTTPEDELEG
ncbi:phosphocarrier protein HPr [Halarchaeum grantii]|uniref:Phosphocarrier protein HPr n=1 Tax=Halarchaeum grantii TaxID=1193105 RepID=A0A830FBD0_9EURY|nr:HPr family phosphocarrier protein [Halarchaeum grantii]GGL37456.1 phosphocarrier protein HPr [Halarchaeum grantii]